MSAKIRAIAWWVVLIGCALGACKQDPSASTACGDAATERACRECCTQAGATGATWLDGDCACLSGE